MFREDRTGFPKKKDVKRDRKKIFLIWEKYFYFFVYQHKYNNSRLGKDESTVEGEEIPCQKKL
ncbi:hypothetical protein FACS189418_2600 [Clostridia bacterium]|nr:hypothetical protein FACS189418_2600 [Clostridia bacterium]